jgi:hypothetical protein
MLNSLLISMTVGKGRGGSIWGLGKNPYCKSQVMQIIRTLHTTPPPAEKASGAKDRKHDMFEADASMYLTGRSF